MNPPPGLARWSMVLRVTCGNFLEMFDFFLFGLYARPIAAGLSGLSAALALGGRFSRAAAAAP